jgi:hypothetical protein
VGATGETITVAASAIGQTGSFYQYAYNGPGPSGGVGFTTDTYCNPGDVCGGSGTTDTTGTLNASTEQTSISALVNNGQTTLNAAAFASANLAAGTVGVAGSGTYYGISGVGSGSSNSYALADDGLNFTVAGAGADTVTDIVVNYQFDGTVAYSNPGGDVSVSSYLNFGNAGLSLQVTTIDGAAVLETPGTAGWVSTEFISEAAGDVDFQGVYALTGPVTSLDVQFAINALCGEGASCDYSHTGAVSLDLPSNVSFTSDSGVFLTQAAPEPGTVWLLAAALGGVGLLRRRCQM